MCRGNIQNNINEIIDNLELEDYKKLILRKRFLQQVILYDKKSRHAEFFYIFFSLFVTIGSIILPALLSIQQLDYSEDDSVDEEYRTKVYWTTWGISLLVSIFNGILQLFSLGKQYVSYNTTREKLISEGWQYFQLSGDYEDSTHEDSFTDFCEEIEKIKKSQVDKDFMFINPNGDKKGKKNKNKDNNSIGSSSTSTISPQIINHSIKKENTFNEGKKNNGETDLLLGSKNGRREEVI